MALVAGMLLVVCLVLCCAGSRALAAGTPAGTIIANQATVVYDDDQGTQQAPIYANTLTFTVGQIAVINLSPASAAKSARLGSVVDYASRITNSGNGSDYFTFSTRSSLNLSLATYHDMNSNGLLDNDEYVAGEIFAVGLVADGQISIITRLQIPDSVELDGLSDLLTVKSTSMFDTTRSATGQYTTRIESSALVVAKSVSNPTPASGSRVTYTISSSNTGHAPAAGIRVVDVLNPSLRYVAGSANPAPASVSGQTLTWDLAGIDGGAGAEITFEAEVAGGLQQGVVIHNSADVTWLDGAASLATTSSESSFITVASGGTGAVTIAPDRSGAGEPGDTIDQALTVANNGFAAERFDLRFESTRGLLWELRQDSDSNGRIDAGEPVVTTTGVVNAGGRFHLVARTTLPVVESDRTADSTVFRAIPQSNPTAAARAISVTEIGIPVMTLVKTTAQPVQRSGGEITYSISYTNDGSGRAYEFAVIDSIPARTVYVPGSIRVNAAPRTEAIDADGVDVTNGIVTVMLGTVMPASAGTIEFRVRIE
jgi:uncharacterized repeat protein (TIGR01451 family)